MSDLRVSMEVARGESSNLHPAHQVEKGMLLIKLIVEHHAQVVLFMRIREIIRIKILNKIAIIQKICMKTTQTTTKTHKVTTRDNLSANLKRQEV